MSVQPDQDLDPDRTQNHRCAWAHSRSRSFSAKLRRVPPPPLDLADPHLSSLRRRFRRRQPPDAGSHPCVTYLPLDSSVEPEKRFEILKAFNSDPTIDVLLLIIHVGGLGLNLTSADMLVFMEHDWSPMNDQAMDRAHSLGQRKVVNVHRLIMRGTLEERVMSLQKFKVSVAIAVINAENASLKTMKADQLLDLFTSAPSARKGSALSSSSNGDLGKNSKSMADGKGLKAILSGLAELWDQLQYADEHNLGHFLAKLNG